MIHTPWVDRLLDQCLEGINGWTILASVDMEFSHKRLILPFKFPRVPFLASYSIDLSLDLTVYFILRTISFHTHIHTILHRSSAT
jgi:hypothetical protein